MGGRGGERSWLPHGFCKKTREECSPGKAVGQRYCWGVGWGSGRVGARVFCTQARLALAPLPPPSENNHQPASFNFGKERRKNKSVI